MGVGSWCWSVSRASGLGHIYFPTSYESTRPQIVSESEQARPCSLTVGECGCKCGRRWPSREAAYVSRRNCSNGAHTHFTSLDGNWSACVVMIRERQVPYQRSDIQCLASCMRGCSSLRHRSREGNAIRHLTEFRIPAVQKGDERRNASTTWMRSGWLGWADQEFLLRGSARFLVGRKGANRVLL